MTDPQPSPSLSPVGEDDPWKKAVDARNALAKAIAGLRGGHAARMDDCDNALAGLDIALVGFRDALALTRAQQERQIAQLNAALKCYADEQQKDRAEIARAMAVLQPNAPESGLEDACRQVKQVAISAMGNCETLQAALAQAQQERDEVSADALAVLDLGSLWDDSERNLWVDHPAVQRLYAAITTREPHP